MLYSKAQCSGDALGNSPQRQQMHRVKQVKSPGYDFGTAPLFPGIQKNGNQRQLRKQLYRNIQSKNRDREAAHQPIDRQQACRESPFPLRHLPTEGKQRDHVDSTASVAGSHQLCGQSEQKHHSEFSKRFADHPHTPEHCAAQRQRPQHILVLPDPYTGLKHQIIDRL